MANLPPCPNVAIGQCPRSDIAVGGEGEDRWCLVCHTCHLVWVLTKPRTKARAQYENEIAELKQRSAHRPRIAYGFLGGANHA